MAYGPNETVRQASSDIAKHNYNQVLSAHINRFCDLCYFARPV
jgi:hypothetical protein